ncbi:MAG: RimK family alpha-L-glutamate ligase [Candidatus Methanoperedens sp.]|nr:RimK family alpha-L-glutamate ligase [Candidatus Methanoperedens sp.]
MKKIGISMTDPTDWTCVALQNSIRRSGMEPLMLSLGDATSRIASDKLYSGNIDLADLDAIIVRDLGSSTKNDVSFRFDILCQLEEMGVAIINSPDSIAKAANKYVSSYIFQKNGITTPATIVTNSLKEGIVALTTFGTAVSKPVFGYKGIGVECLRNNDKGRSRLMEIMKTNGLVYLQKFIANPGRDVRVFIVNNKVAGSIYRIAPEGNWINNLSQGGTAKPCTLTAKQEKLSLKASKAIGTTYAGVDIIEGDRPYVIEINGTPSGKGIFDATGVDVTVGVVEYLLDLVK